MTAFAAPTLLQRKSRVVSTPVLDGASFEVPSGRKLPWGSWLLLEKEEGGTSVKWLGVSNSLVACMTESYGRGGAEVYIYRLCLFLELDYIIHGIFSSTNDYNVSTSTHVKN